MNLRTLPVRHFPVPHEWQRETSGKQGFKFTDLKPHYHNFLFQLLIVTGLPGLLLAGAICLLLVVKTIKLFFSKDTRASLAVKTLCLPVTASLIYYLFEVSLFTEIDVRPLYAFLFFGLLLGFYHDLYPRKTS